MGIDWAAFDWQSFATLTTGTLAVGAAFVVGKRQTAIAEKQTALLEWQTRLEEISVRGELFDKRYSVFERARDFVMHIIHHAEVAEGELRNEFLMALNETRFLFAPSVHTKLEEIWKEAGKLAVLKADMRSTYQRHGHYGEGNPQKEYELLTKFDDYRRSLTDVFEEMKLGGHLISEPVGPDLGGAMNGAARTEPPETKAVSPPPAR